MADISLLLEGIMTASKSPLVIMQCAETTFQAMKRQGAQIAT